MAVEVTCAECGKPLSRCPSRLRARNFCDLACLGRYRTTHWTGTKAAHWKGGTTKDRDRVLWHLPWHPSADGRGYVARYRVVAELKLRRSLRPGEIVHHVDGDETNDHPDNLLVMTQSEHAREYDARRPRRNGHDDVRPEHLRRRPNEDRAVLGAAS